MASLASAASTQLDSAISSLDGLPPDPHTLASAARTLARQADEAELTALETADRNVRAHLLRRVQAARVAAHTARQTARQHALESSRTTLLVPPPNAAAANATAEEKQFKDGAQKLARDINESLRRSTAAVSEEVHRSRTAGDVISDSTRILAKTANTHGKMHSSIARGRRTLTKIRSSETVANVVVLFSFVFFFAVAFYVAKKRVKSSVFATVFIKPVSSALRLPARALFYVAAGKGGKRKLTPLKTVTFDEDNGARRQGGNQNKGKDHPPSLSMESDSGSLKTDDIEQQQSTKLERSPAPTNIDEDQSEPRKSDSSAKAEQKTQNEHPAESSESLQTSSGSSSPSHTESDPASDTDPENTTQTPKSNPKASVPEPSIVSDTEQLSNSSDGDNGGEEGSEATTQAEQSKQQENSQKTGTIGQAETRSESERESSADDEVEKEL